MTDRRTAHKNAILLAFALTAFIVGTGIPAVSAVSSNHTYTLPIKDAWFGFDCGYLYLYTTSTSYGTGLGTVLVSQSFLVLPPWYNLVIWALGTSVSIVSPTRKIAHGHFLCQVYLLFIVIDQKFIDMHTQVTCQNGVFSYVDWYTIP